VIHEQGLGITRGHEEATAFIERCLEKFEMPSWEPASDPPHAAGQGVTTNTIT